MGEKIEKTMGEKKIEGERWEKIFGRKRQKISRRKGKRPAFFGE